MHNLLIIMYMYVYRTRICIGVHTPPHTLIVLTLSFFPGNNTTNTHTQ